MKQIYKTCQQFKTKGREIEKGVRQTIKNDD